MIKDCKIPQARIREIMTEERKEEGLKEERPSKRWSEGRETKTHQDNKLVHGT